MTDDVTTETFLRPIDDPAAIAACYDAHGVVAVTGVLTKAECSETMRDMGMPPSFDIRDPATYTLPEVEATLNRYGVVGRDTLWTPTILRNRCHPHVVKAFQTVYGTDALLASHDRAAIMRPTSGVEGASMDTEYHYPGLHLDVDLQSYCSEDAHTEAAVRTFLDSLLYGDDRDFTAENNAKHWRMGRHVQSVLNLIDNRREDGGFQCVPMADPAAWLREWTPTQRWSTPPEPNGRYMFTPRSYEALGIPAVRVPCPAGTLILFDACLPHGTLPNRSGRPRAIQFLRYIPEAVLSERSARGRKAAVRRHCRRVGFEPATPEQARVLF